MVMMYSESLARYGHDVSASKVRSNLTVNQVRILIHVELELLRQRWVHSMVESQAKAGRQA
jgi:hypothetical protein